MAERIRSFVVDRREGGASQTKSDEVAVEEPLEIRINDEPLAVVMRTPGHDIELAAGLLFSEEILLDPDDVGTIAHCRDPDNPELENVVNVRLSDELAGSRATEKAERSLLTTSSCGICGKRSIESIHHRAPPLDSPPTIDRALIDELPSRMSEAQEVFHSTGGLHASAIFDGETGELLVIREDVGRHNAADKAIGSLFLTERLPLRSAVLMVSGRTSFEIVQKALVARIATVVAVSAPSSLAVELARESNMTLLGFVRGGSFNVYAGKIS